jgi:hypothetical protein
VNTSSRLTPAQEELLFVIVEANRAVPREEFYFFESFKEVQHPGLSENPRKIFPADLRALSRSGLLDIRESSKDLSSFEPTNRAFEVYSELKRRQGEPTRRVEAHMRSCLEQESFRLAHPKAFERWSQAEQLLWNHDSSLQLTNIGHLAREAMQEFADSLVKRTRVLEGDADKAKTINRMRSVLAARLGARESRLVNALMEYWCAIEDLVQRQEHGALREKEDLTWGDARRVVFQVMVVMFEIESSLSVTS